MNLPFLLQPLVHPQKISGISVEAKLPNVAMGELCNIISNWKGTEIVAKAQVISLEKERAILALIGTSTGLTLNSVIQPTGHPLTVLISDSILGSVIDPNGKMVERFSKGHFSNKEKRVIHAPAPEYFTRIGINQPIATGIKVIDGLLTCGIGQRIGIFSSAGCGKTILLHMLINNTEADVFVIGLIGERGREVAEFIENLKSSSKKDNCVVVFATSNFSSIERYNSALLATTIAEYFRDNGKQVILFIDSITRCIRAARDIALNSGEPPAKRGYPASVFDNLPQILERPGLTCKGSITAFYTVLLENDDEPDPIADEIRSILDGHIYLSMKLAAQGHYPAIDVSKSISRVFERVTNEEHRIFASKIRKLINKLEELQLFLDLGEYNHGENTDNDIAMMKKKRLLDWQKQKLNHCSSFSETLQEMANIANT